MSYHPYQAKGNATLDAVIQVGRLFIYAGCFENGMLAARDDILVPVPWKFPITTMHFDHIIETCFWLPIIWGRMNEQIIRPTRHPQ